MIVENGERRALVIDGVFDGEAGVVGDRLSFIPNRTARSPVRARGGLLAGVPITFRAYKDEAGPFWTARFKVSAA